MIGFSPQDVNSMTPYEFAMAVQGWAKAHGAGEKTERTYPTDEEYNDAVMRLH